MKTSSKLEAAIISTAVMVTLGIGATAFAQNVAGVTATATAGAHQGWIPGSNGGARRAPGVFGTVSAISGDTITVTSKGFGSTATPTTYSVNATNATVTKVNAASSVSAIAVGDTVMVQGTVSGTNVTATAIRDGVMMGKGMMGHGGMASSTTGMRTPTSVITGNGEPVVGGTVTAISGTTLTVTNKSNVTYSIDASSATAQKGNAASSVASIAVGDNVIIQGTVSGNSVVASSVIDQAAPSAGAGASTSGTTKPAAGGFFGGIGSFFHKLFGFF